MSMSLTHQLLVAKKKEDIIMNALITLYVNFMDRIKALKESKKGQTLVEYALILVLIAIVAIVAMKAVGSNVSTAFSQAANTLQTR